jgi:hypothetical protein
MTIAPRHLALGTLALAIAFPGSSAAAADALVLSTDYSTAYYSRLGLAPPFPHTNQIEFTCADAVARPHGGLVYVLGRFGCDHVQVVDGTTFATLHQFTVGNGTNPQDIEVVSPTKAYVSLYERDYLQIVDPSTGALGGTVSLAALADADGLPEAAEMAQVGGRLFVALQRLSRPAYSASNPSYLAVVDVTTDQLVDVDPVTPGLQPIVLTGRNPFAEIVLDPVRQKLVVTETGSFGPLDGGVEFVDPVTLQPEGFFVTEAALGGDLNGVRLWTDCTGFAIVNSPSFQTRLVRFDRCGGTLLGTCWTSAGFDLCDLEIDYAGARVFVSDRDLLTPGVRVFAAGSCTQITTSPIGLGLPPCDIAVVDPVEPTSAPPPFDATLRLVPNWPDPFNPTTRLRIEAPAGERVQLEILDVAGRRVRTLWDGPTAGREIVWDGRDGSGNEMPSGVYFARLRGAASTRLDRLTLVR